MNILLLIIFCSLVGYFSYISKGKNFLLPDQNSDIAVGFSYGATLMSTSAIVGIGGLAGWLGYSVFTGVIAVAISLFFTTRYIGPKIYNLNKKIKAQTYVELVSKHYKSKLLGTLLASVIVALIPFYSSAIMIGISKFINVFTEINYELSLVIFSVVTGITVLYGGMKSVLRNDAMQGMVLIAGSIIILLYTLGVHIIGTDYITTLTEAWNTSQDPITGMSKKIGFLGYTSYPAFLSPGWMFIVSFFVFTIPVGMIALPQLQTRFLLAKNEESFKHISWYGLVLPVLILLAFLTAGVTSNSFFYTTEGLTGVWSAKGIDSLIPNFIAKGYPTWIGSVLFVTILAAAFSTLNSLMHLMASTVSHDLGFKEKGKIVSVIGVIGFTLLISLMFQKEPAFIARSTGLFFSILGGSLLPCVIGMVFKVSNSKAALVSFTGGTIASLVWIFFFHFKEAKLFGVSQFLFDTPVIMLGRYSFIDTVIPALIVSSIIFYTYNRFGRESNE